MRIETTQLRSVLDRLLTHLEQTGRSSIDLTDDYYWFVPREGRYDPYKQPVELTLGQLTDDWRELSGIEAGSREPFGYGLVWLASILVAIGEREPS